MYKYVYVLINKFNVIDQFKCALRLLLMFRQLYLFIMQTKWLQCSNHRVIYNK